MGLPALGLFLCPMGGESLEAEQPISGRLGANLEPLLMGFGSRGRHVRHNEVSLSPPPPPPPRLSCRAHLCFHWDKPLPGGLLPCPPTSLSHLGLLDPSASCHPPPSWSPHIRSLQTTSHMQLVTLPQILDRERGSPHRPEGQHLQDNPASHVEWWLPLVAIVLSLCHQASWSVPTPRRVAGIKEIPPITLGPRVTAHNWPVGNIFNYCHLGIFLCFQEQNPLLLSTALHDFSRLSCPCPTLNSLPSLPF